MSDTLLRGKFNCLGQVTASGYKYDGPPRDYDMNNPTGYMTGQWIDVEVIEVSSVPALYSKKIFNPGEFIQGFWSYGGDDGIVGKPQVGDVVGYYEAKYAHVWEKVS
jgi:hypothetical protein